MVYIKIEIIKIMQIIYYKNTIKHKNVKMIDQDLLQFLINNIYLSIKETFYSYGKWGKNKYKDSDKKITKDDKLILAKIILIVLNNTDSINKEDIYISCLYYYYASIKLEDGMIFKINDVKLKTEQFNICSFKININVDKCWLLIDNITISNDKWASDIRKIVNFPHLIISNDI